MIDVSKAFDSCSTRRCLSKCLQRQLKVGTGPELPFCKSPERNCSPPVDLQASLTPMSWDICSTPRSAPLWTKILTRWKFCWTWWRCGPTSQKPGTYAHSFKHNVVLKVRGGEEGPDNCFHFSRLWALTFLAIAGTPPHSGTVCWASRGTGPPRPRTSTSALTGSWAWGETSSRNECSSGKTFWDVTTTSNFSFSNCL